MIARLAVVPAALVTAAAGCGGEEEPATAPAQGTFTSDDEGRSWRPRDPIPAAGSPGRPPASSTA